MHGWMAAYKISQGNASGTDMTRDIRNRLTHGYFDINLDVVWDTVQTALPGLLAQLPAVRDATAAEGMNGSGE